MSLKSYITVALVAIGSLNSAAFAETLQFEANLSSENVIAGGSVASTSAAGGLATFELTYDPADLTTATLSYDIRLTGADLDGLQTTDLLDDITAIHIHDVGTCVGGGCIPGDTAGTLHVLNIFGMPRQDDVNLTVMPEASRLTGMWDASDANALTPAPSQSPGDYISELLAGEIYLMAHSREFAGGALGGQLVQVPEPTSAALLLIGAIPFFRRR